MRIISGIAKGRKLISPVGKTTRPTLDRVKESMFDILNDKVLNASVLDAFSGTGSLGLEAVSRGAKECVLIDGSKETFSFLFQNVKNLKFDDKCKCYNMDSFETVKKLGENNNKYDIIFIDPPYSKNMIPKVVETVDSFNMLLKDGIIVTKIDYRENLYEGTDNIRLIDHRKYGKTIICFYRHKGEIINEKGSIPGKL